MNATIYFDIIGDDPSSISAGVCLAGAVGWCPSAPTETRRCGPHRTEKLKQDSKHEGVIEPKERFVPIIIWSPCR